MRRVFRLSLRAHSSGPVSIFSFPARLLSLLLSLSIASQPIVALPTHARSQFPVNSSSTESDDQLREDVQLAFWSLLDHEHPALAEFMVENKNTPLPWVLDESDPLVDEDPFFMRTQRWDRATDGGTCGASVCFEKRKDALDITLPNRGQVLKLAQAFTPILETETHLFMSADDARVFQAKVPDAEKPGEGLFFIAKKDLVNGALASHPVPIFFFPLPGDDGWTGPNPYALENEITNQVVIRNKHDKFGLPIDQRDIDLLERVQRNNLVLALTWSYLEGQVDARGFTLPKPGTTAMFGLLPSGQLPNKGTTTGALSPREIMRRLGRSFLPEAAADDNQPSGLRRLMARVWARAQQDSAVAPAAPATVETGETAEPAPVEDRSTQDAQDQELQNQNQEQEAQKKGRAEYWKKWISPTALYGFTGVSAWWMYDKVDWTALITDDMGRILTIIAAMLAGVAVTSTTLKYTLHRDHFNKIYPKRPGETMLQFLHRHHKGIVTEIANGFYFSETISPQGLRHLLDFLKDRFVPGSKLIHKAWEATMGFQMKQNSSLAMNWKTYYYGLVFGLADATLVFVHMMIYAPFLFSMFDLAQIGAAMAAFASLEVVRNFLGYIRKAAHIYSADVKFIHLHAAEEEAKRILAARGENVKTERAKEEIHYLTLEILDKLFRSLGLPGREEFLYDPISVIEGMARKMGFTIPEMQNLDEDQQERLRKHRFVLARRHWGLIGPAFKRALRVVRDTQARAPSDVGSKVVEFMEWATSERSNTAAVAGRAWDVATSEWGADGLKQSVTRRLAALRSQGAQPKRRDTIRAIAGGVLDYVVTDAAQRGRDIRGVMFLMSSTKAGPELAQFFPKSWREKARELASNEVEADTIAYMAANYLHRSFFSHYEKDRELVLHDEKLEAEYGEHAQAELEQMVATVPELQDPFVRETYYWELMKRLKTKDQAARAVREYKPKALSAKSAAQWDRARGKILDVWSQVNTDDSVSSQWLTVIGRYQDISKNTIAGTSDWVRIHRYRMAVTKAIAEQVGLYVNDVDQSEFVQKVAAEAAVEAELELSQPHHRAYMENLDKGERSFYEAQVFSQIFINNYVRMAVHSDKHLSGLSPEFPGPLQRWRRALVAVPGGRTVSWSLRFFESFCRNEVTSYQPGALSMLDRTVPLVPDMIRNMINTSRNLPYNLTLHYLNMAYVWQLEYSYPLWMLFMFMAFLHPTFVAVNNRVQRNYNRKPMDTVPEKLTFSWLHSHLTNPELVFLQMFAQDIVDGFDKHVSRPLVEGAGTCLDFLQAIRPPTSTPAAAH